MRAKAKISPTKSRRRKAKARRGDCQDNAPAAWAEARAEDNPAASEVRATLGVNITRVVGTFCRFWIVDSQTQKTVAASELYDNHAACKEELIRFIKAIQADDFDVFDHT